MKPRDAEGPQNRWSASIWKVVLGYAVFASLWILISDHLVVHVTKDPGRIAILSVLKGWLFVGATSFLLFRVLNRLFLRAGDPPERRGKARRFVPPVLLLGLAIVLLTGLGIHEAFRQQEIKAEARLQAIATLKARQVTDWVKERMGDAEFVASSQVWSKAYLKWTTQGDAAEGEHLLARLGVYRRIKGFQDARILDASGDVARPSFGPGAGIAAELKEGVLRASRTGGVRVIGPYRGGDGCLRLDFLASLPRQGGAPGPVVVLSADPAKNLFQVVNDWPVPSATGEAVLFHREGVQIHYLSDSTLRPGSLFNQFRPLGSAALLSAQVLRGERRPGTFFKGVDYRGEPTAGVVEPIPGTDWFLLAKMDLSEIEAGARGEATFIALAGLLGLFLAALGTHLFQQHRLFAQAERERGIQTERIRALQLLDGIANASTDVIFAKDMEGQYVLFNPEAERVYGLVAAEVLGKGARAVVPEREAARIRETDQAVLSGNAAYTTEEIFTTSIGPRTFLVTKGPLKDAQGETRGLYGIAKDITERVRAEKERQDLQAEIQQAQKMESIGRLAGGVAHDFNNMLGVIVANAEIGLMGGTAEATQARFEDILKAALRSADLTRQLLAFARKQAVSPKVLNLNTAIPGMLQMLARLIGENIELDYAPQAGLGQIRMDPSQLDQILANLAVNARDAITGVGRLRIQTENVTLDEAGIHHNPGWKPGAYVLLSVSDTGCGMDAELQQHIFEPFFTNKEQGKGTGLGLATVYGIVNQNGGFIDVESQVGKGSLFRVYLPRVEEGPEASPAAPAAVSRGGGERILVVEDEPMNLEVTGMLLKSLGYDVLAEGSPSEALRRLGEDGPSIKMLLTDIIMPEMNGRELADRARALNPGLKCLFMSGYTADVIAHHGILDHDVKLVGKPFTLEELAIRVREVLDV